MRELVAASAQDGADLDASGERAARSVLRRLRALSPHAQALALTVAVFDAGVALHQAATLAGLGAEAAVAAADELARADILVASDPVAFAPSAPARGGLRRARGA